MNTEQCEVTMQGFADATATAAEKLEYSKCIEFSAEQFLIEQCKDINDSNTFLTIIDSEPLIFGLIFVTIVAVAFAMGRIVKKQNKETGLDDK